VTLAPNLRYFEACAGTWRSPLDLRVTNLAALWGSEMAYVDRVALCALALWPNWLGRPCLHTSVSMQTEQRVLHTTVVRFFGVLCLRSEEMIYLAPDGHAFTVVGAQLDKPFWGTLEPVIGKGEVNSDATAASYQIQFLGVLLMQTTTRDSDLVTLNQHGPGWEGIQRLRRISEK
jgi:hypothetical protein